MMGGNQDRVLAQDIILEPGESVDIPVFCVEKDRSYSIDGSNEFWRVLRDIYFNGAQCSCRWEPE